MQSDLLFERAKELVSMAHAAAIESSELFLSKFENLIPENTKESKFFENCDFIITVAGVFSACSRLRNLLKGSKIEGELMGVISEEFQKWNPDAFQAFASCKSFYNDKYDSHAALLRIEEKHFLSSDLIGMWIALNLFNSSTNRGSAEEREYIRTVGTFIAHRFYDWWTD